MRRRGGKALGRVPTGCQRDSFEMAVLVVCRCVSRCAICKAGEAPPRAPPPATPPAPRPRRLEFKTRKNLPCTPLASRAFTPVLSQLGAQPFATLHVLTHTHISDVMHNAADHAPPLSAALRDYTVMRL
ncbi:unnamed protein product, partial [Brenthis ino]